MREIRVNCATAMLLIGTLSILSMGQTSTNGVRLAKSIRPLVLTGQPAPGGDVFRALGKPSINRAGTVAFQADLTGRVVSYGPYIGKETPGGIFVAKDGLVSRVVGSGDVVPNRDATFIQFGDPVINDGGQTAFVAQIGKGQTNHGLYMHTNGGLLPIAVTGESAPDTNGGTFLMFGRSGLAINNAGAIAFEATFSAPGPTQPANGIFLFSKGIVRAAVLRGQPSPGTPNETLDRFLGLAMNQSGQIAFSASLQGSAARAGLFVLDAAGIRPMALQGQKTSQGDILDHFGQPSISDGGDVTVVHTTLVPSGRGARAISDPDGVLIAAGTPPLPGVSMAATSMIASVRHKRNPADPALTGNVSWPVVVQTVDGTSSVLFAAWNETKGRNALFLNSPNALTQLVQEGESSPAGGTYFFMGQPTISPSGYFTFVSRLKGASAEVGLFIGRISF